MNFNSVSNYLRLYNKCIRQFSLDNHEKLVDFFKKTPFNYRFDQDENLYLVTYRKNSELYEDDTISSGMGLSLTCMMRGAIFEKGTNKPICLPMFQFIHNDEYKSISTKDYEFTEAIDGTQINLFNYRGSWRLSTRGMLDALDSYWRNYCSFGDMALEAFGNFDFSKLNVNYCYSFVLTHTEHTHIIKHNVNRLYHVFTRDMLTFKEVHNINIGISQPKKRYFISNRFIDVYLNNSNLSNSIGFVAKNIKTGTRHMLHSEQYKKMKSLIKNHHDIYDIFIDNYTGIDDSIQNIKHILSHFKDWKYEWRWVLHTYTDLIDEIENYYNLCYKRRKYQVLPYYLKPILYEIHKIYISRKHEWYRIHRLRTITEPYYSASDIESNPRPQIIRYDIMEWFANLPFKKRREIFHHFSKMN